MSIRILPGFRYVVLKVKGHRKLEWTVVARKRLTSLLGLQLGLEDLGGWGYKGQGGYPKHWMGVNKDQIL